MTNEEKLAEVRALINDETVSDSVISSYLKISENKILERVYPFRDTTATKEVVVVEEGEDGKEIEVTKIVPKYPMPPKYDHLQTELASRYIFRRGFEGQLSQHENGVIRGYASVNDEDLLSEVMQNVGVI